MRKHERSFSRNTEAVSEIIGEVLLTGIAVIAFSIIAVFIFSTANPDDRVYADIDGWVNVNEDSIVLRHAGGEAIDLGITRVLLDLNGTRKELGPDDLVSLSGNDAWQLGEMITINTSSLWNIVINENDSISTAIINKDSNLVIKSGTLLGFERTASNGGNNGNVTPPQPPASSLPVDQVAWWKLDEGTRMLASDSVATYDGSISGALWSIGINGSALDFDGNNDYVQVNGKIILDYPFSISAWVKTGSSGSDMAIVNLASSGSNKRHYGIYVDTAGRASLIAENPQSRIITGDIVNDGNWHHIVGVFTSLNDRDLYVDGVFNGNDVRGSSFDLSCDRWTFGRWGDSSPDGYFHGSMDEIKLWDRALNDTEVQQIYQNP